MYDGRYLYTHLRTPQTDHILRDSYREGWVAIELARCEWLLSPHLRAKLVLSPKLVAYGSTHLLCPRIADPWNIEVLCSACERVCIVCSIVTIAIDSAYMYGVSVERSVTYLDMIHAVIHTGTCGGRPLQYVSVSSSSCMNPDSMQNLTNAVHKLLSGKSYFGGIGG